MSSTIIARYVNPWKYRRAQQAQRLAELRKRDGDACKRCKRPMRFDLPDGHDLGPKIEHVVHSANGGIEALDNLCLTHGRCNGKAGDDTGTVKHRSRVKNEVALFEKARRKRRPAADEAEHLITPC